MPQKLTPLLAQYRRIKQKHRDTLLLFRVGDFYEMFYEDAEVGARALGLTLTSRPHGPHNRVPLAGVPARSLDTYVGRLVNQGFRVAVCDQLEQPVPGKPVVRRDVVEIITPGTLTRPGLLDEHRNNYLLALSPAGDTCGIAFADVSTGDFRVAEVATARLDEEIQKVEPRELLVPRSWDAGDALPEDLEVTRLEDYYFSEDYAFDKLTSHFGVASLDGFGVGGMSEGICAAGAALHYLEETQRTALSHLQRLSRYHAADYLLIDRISRRNLEIVERVHPADRRSPCDGTLFGVLDRTRTAAGSRLLRRWLLAPLLDPDRIRARHDVVEELLDPASPADPLGECLGRVGDLERVSSRVALERANARELAALGTWLRVAPEVRELLRDCRACRLAESRASIEDFSAVADAIDDTLVDDPPVALTEGGLIRPGVNAELDELRGLTRDGKSYIAGLQETERRRTGITNLKVGFNSVFGYYIEVTRANLERVPRDYLRKQTLTNAERFITPELKEYESRVLHAEERADALEHELFVALRRRIATEVPRVLRLSGVLAELDVLAGFARAARENRYTRPSVDDSRRLDIEAGRHPVVEKMLDEPFIDNDTALDSDEQQVLIITGPNMAGKSTYLRQVALTCIMAQAGSFVPARSARVGIVDKVFTRIGASDDVARGVSTFLAEMTETANILNNATSKSLVILDEVGRGTATNDGLAIAWAAVEYLHGPPERRPRTLFATHYHELADTALLLPRLRNYNFSVKEQPGGVLFLRKMKPGPASKSYGIAVARLAGLPRSVVDRAREVLAGFERGEKLSLDRLIPGADEMPLAADRPETHPALSRLRELDLDELSPLQALNLLAELQRQARQDDDAPLPR